MKFISTIASLAACASAYKILTPTLNSTIAKGSTVNVQFSTVDTDPTTFSVYLVNFQTGHFPPDVISLAQNVQQSAGSSPRFSLTGDCVDPVAATPSSTPSYSNASVSDISINVVTTVVYPDPILWFYPPTGNGALAAASQCSAAPSLSSRIPCRL
ncbi:hypothetical protein MRB53_039222 [Persea americana]|nr:hypothetical protein MRB53_039222 [Persea americana]